MKTNRSSSVIRNTFLALVSTVVFAGLANAQGSAYKGQFTLPFEAKWGNATLPAGDYTFTLDSAALPAMVRIETTDRYIGLVIAQDTNASHASKGNELIVTRSGGYARISALHLATLATDFEYATPKAERQVLASAPKLIQSLPIHNGK